LGTCGSGGSLLATTLAVGTVGYRLVEGWNWLDSFFMPLITVTTVGYGEVHPLDPGGKVFTSVVIAGGAARSSTPSASSAKPSVGGSWQSTEGGEPWTVSSTASAVT
jgi:voltage-gated potassium channel